MKHYFVFQNSPYNMQHTDSTILYICQSTSKTPFYMVLSNPIAFLLDFSPFSNFTLDGLIWFVDWLISLFNGISTFVGYLMPKPFS